MQGRNFTTITEAKNYSCVDPTSERFAKVARV